MGFNFTSGNCFAFENKKTGLKNNPVKSKKSNSAF